MSLGERKAAELVIINGTLPETSGSVNVAVSGGAVLAVAGQDVLALVGPGTRVLDAEGGAVLPGINDAHLHFIASAMTRFGYLDVGASAASSWQGVAGILAAAAP